MYIKKVHNWLAFFTTNFRVSSVTKGKILWNFQILKKICCFVGKLKSCELFLLTHSATSIFSISSRIFSLYFPVNVVDGEMLLITKVSRLHMAAYLCVASNGVPPSISKRVQLRVQCKLKCWYWWMFIYYKNVII